MIILCHSTHKEQHVLYLATTQTLCTPPVSIECHALLNGRENDGLDPRTYQLAVALSNGIPELLSLQLERHLLSGRLGLDSTWTTPTIEQLLDILLEHLEERDTDIRRVSPSGFWELVRYHDLKLALH